GRWGNFLEFEQIDYQHMLQLNIQALVDLSYALLPRMIKLGSGGIINVASTAAFMPIAGFAVYSASKSFVLYFTEALHGEVAETGVTISCLCPGATNTKFSQVAAVNYPSMADTFHGISPDLVATKCLQGFIQCKLLIVPGGIKDKIAIFIPRILSRKYTIFTVKKIWSKMRGILK
ncbi:MAG: SDR family NAD(P)-dependent oxidoreductase, partial [Legionellales bacterium]|nr:SDR family NAD(P)-dependent oxidoreductase [Legionellales bacterium]